MQQNLQQNKKLIQNVFNSVVNEYDLMNDLMSFGVHRIWKKELIQMINPSQKQKLIDVASGTGDLGKLYSEATQNKSEILCIDPNKKMVEEGKKKLIKYQNIRWKIGPAENLKVPSNCFDFYIISFGLRNTRNLNKSISEAYRVLKKGGRFVCLEFSKIENSNLNFIYKNYSKIIPIIGKLVVGDKKPYEYLIKSIDEFLNQNQLLEILVKNNFQNCYYRNLSGGIVAIHTGWKI
tara:strand:+ start:938 stop:1642 length:705 start_codon:yes stop_codon:yes gene_type:complete